MAKIYDIIAPAIKSAADSTGEAIKIMLGTTGSLLEHPTGIYQQFKQTLETGQLWDTASSFLPHVLTQLGAEMDKAVTCWGVIVTGATSVPALFQKEARLSTVSKDEGADTLRIVFDNVFLTANDYVVHATIETPAGGYTCHVTNRQNSQVDIYFHDGAAILDINNRTVNVSIIGYQ